MVSFAQIVDDDETVELNLTSEFRQEEEKVFQISFVIQSWATWNRNNLVIPRRFN